MNLANNNIYSVPHIMVQEGNAIKEQSTRQSANRSVWFVDVRGGRRVSIVEVTSGKPVGGLHLWMCKRYGKSVVGCVEDQ